MGTAARVRLDDADDDVLLTKNEVADFYRISPWTVAPYVKQGIIPPPIELTPGTHRWSRNELKRHKREKQEQAYAALQAAKAANTKPKARERVRP